MEIGSFNAEQRASPRCFLWVVASVLCTASSIQGQPSPSWKESIAHGYLPYHRLVKADFAINNKAHPESAMTTSVFCNYSYKCAVTENDFLWNSIIGDGNLTSETKAAAPTRGFTARVREWKIRSGINRNKSSRKSWYKDLEWGLAHEQGHLDINELHSRRLADIGLDMLPIGEGATVEDATNDLATKLKAFAAKALKDSFIEQEAYDAKTVHGTDRPRQMAARAAIQKRLKEAGITYTNQLSGQAE